MKFRCVLPLFLAVLLQAMPLMIAAAPPQTASPDSAWVADLQKRPAASLGSYDAVSSATTIINGPYTITGAVGNPLTPHRLTTSPHVAGSWSSSPSPLAPGVMLNATTGAISGTPTVGGTFVATITAWEFGVGQGSSTSSDFTFIFTNAASPPAFTNPPASQIVPAGTSPAFSAGASGTAPLFYHWQFGGANIPGATNPILQLSNAQTNQSGFYSAVVSNSVGSATSQPAQLLVVLPPDPAVAPALIPVAGPSGTISLTFTALAGYNYLLQAEAVLNTNGWITLTNVPAAFTNNSIHFATRVTNTHDQFYRIIMRND